MHARNLPAFGAVARLAAAEAASLAGELAAEGDAWPPDAVHRARVMCKRLRAVVHLGAGLVAKGKRTAWNDRLSHAARMLAVARDGEVLSQWILAVADDAPPPLQGPLGRMANRLRWECGPGPSAAACAEMVAVLRAVARSWPRSWGKIGDDPAAGFHRSQRRVQAIARGARHTHDHAAWHRLRRWVKYLAYQHQWLDLAAGRKPGKRWCRLRRLGTTMGRMNDMHNLLAWLAAHRFRSRAAAFLRQRALDTLADCREAAARAGEPIN